MQKPPSSGQSSDIARGRAGDDAAPPRGIAAAIACHEAGQLDEAERLYRKLLDEAPDHFEALLLFGMLEQQRGNHERARVLASRAVSVNGRSAEALLAHGLALRALKRPEEALASYDRALAIRPDFAEAHYNRGNALQSLNRMAEALASYDRALAGRPDDAEALNNRGIVLQKLGRHHEALESYGRALAVRGDYAEALDNRGIVLQALGRHEEALASHDRALAIRPRYPEALNNRGNALNALNRHAEALASHDRALAARPDYAEAFNNRAIVLQALGRHEEALASCERALAINPDDPKALGSYGNALQSLHRHEEALASYRRAFSLEPGPVAALNIGNALQALDRYAEALANYDVALKASPGYAEALNNRGNALVALRRHDEALASYASAAAARPDDPEAHWNEALARLLLGDFERGWAKYEWRWQHRNRASAAHRSDRPLWLGRERLEGKTILLHAEQGFGDAIQFIRYATLVAGRGARVVVACHETLHRLFATVEGVCSVVAPEQVLPGEFDFHTPLLSLPLAFGTTLSTIPARIPYLSAKPVEIRDWRSRLAADPRQMKIGLAWKGNPEFSAAKAKSCPIERLATLAGVPGCAFYSLQKDATDVEAAELGRHGRVESDFTRELADFGATAAFVSVLDLVITIDTAVAHLAGALGKPVWILLPWAADWRWLLEREDSPWYPTARLFRQSATGDWGGVVERVARELRLRVGAL